MSNSKLVTYTHYSPNVTKPRRGTIRGVAIHCTAGGLDLPAKSFADMERFAKNLPTTGASCHYVVGGDGSIAQVCDESNRAWCTSNAIDHYLVTIEVASEAAKPCLINDAAYSALLDLLTDICQRNGIPRLLWKADKALMGQWEQQNMVVHRWTANKSCPGDYLYGLHGQIAAAVNVRLAEAAEKAEKEDELDMTIDEMIEKMTNEQAYQLVQKAELHAKTLPEPEWSKKEGAWAAAIGKGLTDGTAPERPVKRCEAMAWLDRLGLLD